MKNIYITISMLLAAFTTLNAQNNSLVIRNNAFVVINGGSAGATGPAVLVINQSHPNGIVTSGTGGNIITQGEFDYVKWNSRTGSGAYTIPFTTDVGNVKIPLVVDVTTAGVGTGYMALSTWDVSAGGGSFNNMPYPSEVIHMAGATGLPDVSAYAVDRFWIIDIADPMGTGETFSTRPTPTLTFNYNTAAAEVADGNLLTTTNLGAQRYDGVTDKWFGWFSGGTPNAIFGNGSVAGVVSNVSGFPTSTWYRTWTLADRSQPLPIELTNFEGHCDDKGVKLAWETQSEINNSYFEIMKSIDGVEYFSIGTLIGAGNSSGILNYEFIDEDGAAEDTYYKLIQVDINGTSVASEPIKVSGCMGDENFTVYPNAEGGINIDFVATFNEDFTITVYDPLGKQIMESKLFAVSEGFNRTTIEYGNIAFGHYMVVLKSNTKLFTKKFVLR